jgi:hypothetical protein
VNVFEGRIGDVEGVIAVNEGRNVASVFRAGRVVDVDSPVGEVVEIWFVLAFEHEEITITMVNTGNQQVIFLIDI